MTPAARLSLALGSLAIIAGCAQPLWVKPGSSQDEFARDRYSCLQDSQQRVGAAAVNQFGGAASNSMQTNGMLFNGCMNARGWQLQQQPQQVSAVSTQNSPTPPAPGTNSLMDADRELASAMDRLCNDPKYQMIVAKSPCRSTTITLSQRTDSDLISAEQKAPFESFQQEIAVVRRKALAVYRSQGGAKGNRLADLIESHLNAADKQAMALFTGAITWGDYNTFRIEDGRKYNAEFAQFRQS